MEVSHCQECSCNRMSQYLYPRVMSAFRESAYKNKERMDIRWDHLLPVADQSDRHLKKCQRERRRVDSEAHRRRRTHLLSMRRGRDLAMPEAGSIGLLPMSMGRGRDKADSGM